MKAPDRGDVILLDFDPQAGREQMKRRPGNVKTEGHAFEVWLPMLVLLDSLKAYTFYSSAEST